MKSKKFVIIDANSLVHRAFHALPPLQTKDGVLVNAVYGFTSILLKVLKDLKPDYIACCFDVNKNTFRKQEYAEYKAHRKEQPNELYHQFPLIKELLEAFKIPVYEKAGFEADDVIGTLSKKTGEEIKDVIVSGDLDLLQLVDDNTQVYTMKRGISDVIIYDESAVKERFGFGPEKLIDYKALRGDVSDNIPGVKGIGEKTAINLIKEFGSLDNIYKELNRYKKLANTENSEKTLKTQKDKFLESSADDSEDSVIVRKLFKPAVIKNLTEHKKDAYLSQKLVRIVDDVKVDFKLKDCEVEEFDTQHVVQLFQMWNFNRLIGQIPKAEEIMKEKQGTLFNRETEKLQNEKTESEFKMKSGYTLIDSEKKFDEFIKKLEKQEQFAIDTETDGLNPFQNKLIGISFSWQDNEAYYLPQQLTTNNLQLTTKLKNILENPAIKKIGHNIKFDLEVLQTAGFDLQGIVFDTMIASYLLNPGTRQHNLDNLAFTELGYRMQSITDLTGESKKDKIDLSKIDVKRVANYSCEDADITWQLYEKLSEKLADEIITNVLEKIEVPLIPVLAEMEKNGIKIDIKFLQSMSKKLESRILNLEARIFKLAGEEFNVASPKQLKEILFEKMKISTQGLGRTKTGISTAAGELDKLTGKHKIIDLILEFRELSKLKNTYLDPLPELVDKKNRVHTSFNQTITATGRLSSSEPNLQNIPIRSDLGREVRKAFIAEPGYQLIKADYSQIELRIIASLSGDKEMISAFNSKRDIHTETASKIFNIPAEKITKDQRRQAKAINFGIIYGQGPRGLSQTAGISYDEAVNFINKYFEVFDGIKNYIEETIALTRELGYSETIFGRRRYLPDINAHHQQIRSAAERMSVNHPIQGTAADLIKIAMINVHKRLTKEFVNDEVRMLLQVHDELVFEVKDDLIKQAKKTIQTEMESAIDLKVPVMVDVESGENWGM